jgi:hypothetical protein
MKLILLYILVFIAGFGSLATMMFADSKPEVEILGTWKEVSWEYESVNKMSDAKELSHLENVEQLSELLGQNLLLHENERWVFKPNGYIVLQHENGTIIKKHRWYLKSRGNVLLFKDNDTILESYSITLLTPKKMILNVNLDIQARGAAKLTFEKVI